MVTVASSVSLPPVLCVCVYVCDWEGSSGHWSTACGRPDFLEWHLLSTALIGRPNGSSNSSSEPPSSCAPILLITHSLVPASPSLLCCSLAPSSPTRASVRLISPLHSPVVLPSFPPAHCHLSHEVTAASPTPPFQAAPIYTCRLCCRRLSVPGIPPSILSVSLSLSLCLSPLRHPARMLLLCLHFMWSSFTAPTSVSCVCICVCVCVCVRLPHAPADGKGRFQWTIDNNREAFGNCYLIGQFVCVGGQLCVCLCADPSAHLLADISLEGSKQALLNTDHHQHHHHRASVCSSEMGFHLVLFLCYILCLSSLLCPSFHLPKQQQLLLLHRCPPHRRCVQVYHALFFALHLSLTYSLTHSLTQALFLLLPFYHASHRHAAHPAFSSPSPPSPSSSISVTLSVDSIRFTCRTVSIALHRPTDGMID